MILVDTSAWIEFDRASGSEVDLRLAGLIAETDLVAVSEPIVMELLAGARDPASEQDIRRLMGRFRLLRFDSAIDFDAAARIYQTCRRRGVTPGGMIDCMIASVALRNDATLLTADQEFRRLSQIIGLRLDIGVEGPR